MCCTIHFGDRLIQAVRDGLVDEERINDSALRIIRTIITFEFEEERKKLKPQKKFWAAKNTGLWLFNPQGKA
jgi:hypothetical protein